ncbi:hypothetical protein SC1083_2038 [Aggregatibacter actinomycetemcomitans serotype e str. SC1083]|uniref:Uncharacterized protein n=1 Tax=Aggregatibacter actinomycetemcomitans serotype e str. SC1083 TaxID=907488 RepID=G4AB08_AGGAC|nr:hypothetical protein SC1083_2038 [Aggregatibacter actinomycetemcomitans serotype e str. SC1083]
MFNNDNLAASILYRHEKNDKKMQKRRDYAKIRANFLFCKNYT